MNTLLTPPIAIIGVSCRFPQAETPEAFWNLLSKGLQTVNELSDERWQIDKYYDPDKGAEGKTNQKHGSLLSNPDDFDPLFFNISPSEAMEMSPSQKLMLELAWEAMEYSNMPLRKWQGSETGVYVGNIWNDFEHHRKHLNATVRQHSAMGQSTNLIANRVSYTFGFTGPSLVLDTGCSSSLVALHLGLQGLWEGSIRQAMVGGINHTLDIDQSVLLSKFGGLSSKGRCSTFDAEGDGFVRGEGAGMVILKKLEDAERDGDNILAVIRGSAMNNNGFNASLPATSVKGQLDVLERAYRNSGIAPGKVHYLEAHGTGTKLGDPTECKALGTFFSTGRNGRLRLGSVKTNVGHTEAAAGMAGLIKVILAMKHRQLPASLNYHTPNPDIDFDGLKLEVQAEAGDWPVASGETMKAGVNSFGWGGTNAHVVVEEYRPAGVKVNPERPKERVHMLPVYARSAQALAVYGKRYLDHLNTQVNGHHEAFMQLCEDAALRSQPMPYRLAVYGRDKRELINCLEEAIAKADKAVAGSGGPHKSVFIFPGQGSQWAGMGAGLYGSEPVFRQAIDACEEAFAPYVNWSLQEVLFASQEENRLNEIDVIQPALCAVMIALARLWEAKGVKPDAVAGHSMGEVAAAHIAGAISLEEAALIICTRSRLMKTVAGKGGAMAVTELTYEEAEATCGYYKGRLSVAVNNSAKSTVLAGDEADIEEVLKELEARGLFGKRVKVDVASHSPQMDPLMEPLRDALGDLKPSSAKVSLYSTVESKLMPGEDMDAAYWVSNLRGTVRYASVIEKLLSEGYTTFIEVSPHPVLSTPTQETASALDHAIISTPTLLRGKNEGEIFYGHFADLMEKGFDPVWEVFYNMERPNGVRLPSYPFQRETYALEDRSAMKSNQSEGKHPLIGEPYQLPGMANTWYANAVISTSKHPYLKDHAVNDEVVLPGAAFVEMAVSVGCEIFDTQTIRLTDLVFEQAVYLKEQKEAKIYLKVMAVDTQLTEFIFYRETGQADNPYKQLCKGRMQLMDEDQLVPVSCPPVSEPVSISQTKDFYRGLRHVGLDYGDHFCGLSALGYYGGNEWRSWLELTSTVVAGLPTYNLHPALLDSCFQSVFADMDTTGKDRSECSAFLTGIEKLTFYTMPATFDKLRLVAHSDDRLVTGAKEKYAVSLTLFADDRAVFTASGIEGTVINAANSTTAGEGLYEKAWVTVEQPGMAAVEGSKDQCWLLIGDENSFTKELALAMEQAQLSVFTAIPGEEVRVEEGRQWTLDPAREDHYRQVAGAKAWTGVIHAACFGDAAEAADPFDSFSAMSLIYTARALNACKSDATLYTLSRGLIPLKMATGPVNLAEAPKSGIARVIMNEMPELGLKYIDLSPKPGPAEAVALVNLLRAGGEIESELALRGSKLYAPRLRAMEDAGNGHTVQYAGDGTYLVTGFRGLGFSFIEQMISNGARYLLLLSRTAMAPAEVMDKIQAYRKEGVRIEIVQADVSNMVSLSESVSQAATGLPVIKGIVHAAGIISPNALTDLDRTELSQILAPKARGAWNLHELSKDYPLEHFIMFSSASALIGLAGQASYVAANTCLDALADYRRGQGLPATSVQWGVIKDVGMVADKSHLQRFAEAEGFVFMESKAAMDLFAGAYHPDMSRIGVCEINGEKMASYYPRFSRAPYFAALMNEGVACQVETVNVPAMIATLESAEEGKNLILSNMIECVANVIKSSPEKLDKSMTFSVLGVDSLMTIQLRNKMEKSLGLKISVASFRQHPTLGEFSSFLYKEVMRSLETVSAGDTKVEHQYIRQMRVQREAKNRLICFHDAGGDSGMYEEWIPLLGHDTEILAVELPGRDGQPVAGEMTMVELAEGITHELTPYLDRPYMLFGHSMGGALLYEVMRSISKAKLQAPVHVMVSSVPMPDAYDRSIVDYRMPEAQLTGFYPQLRLENLGGDEGLQQRLISTIRNDMKVLTTYEYRPQEAWAADLTAFGAEEDNLLTFDQVQKWKGMTRGTFCLVKRPGGHRYVVNDADYLTGYIKGILSKRLTEKIR
ncbi:SDR family NAD(P)-dependent oxidoreductase [Roseivirga sp. BDSF3-8]|uniref:SDR family NAD(P)-dependent oxidoreductase n=1 Tax=Roseivirga sp. BDSF3-8 TaxID=3241598 RepID=UPI003531F791